MGLDQNARSASSRLPRLKKGIVTWLCPPPPPALVRRLEYKPIHWKVLFHNVKIRRVNEKNALKCLSHFTYYLLSLWRSSISRMKIKAAGDLLTSRARGSLSRARFARVLVYFRNERGV